MAKFKVGDIVTGVDDSPYDVTNKYAIMEVLEYYNDNNMHIRLTEVRPDAPSDVKERYIRNGFIGFDDVISPYWCKLYKTNYCYDPKTNKFGYFNEVKNAELVQI